MNNRNPFSKVVVVLLSVVMCLGVLPVSVFAMDYDTGVSSDYFAVISKDEYALAPGAVEIELVLNSTAGDDRKVAHIFEVDTKNPSIAVLPGYYGIDKLDPENLSDSTYWTDSPLTKTVAYYEDVLGYNVVGAMNTALAYDSNAPYGYMVWDGVVLGTPEVHKGAQTYLAIDGEGNCELRSMSTPLDGSEVTAISANFGWLVKDGALVSTSVERTSSDASRSMIGIKADGTLVFCQVDGRNAPTSTGLSNYEMGEMMLAIGCVNAVNCDGGGSSTFISKREGTSENVMRSVPSDGSERPTINSVILVSKAQATGIFDHAVLDSEFDYYAPGTSATMLITGVDASGSPAELPEEGISWQLSDSSFGTVANGVFTSNGKKGDVTVQMVYEEKVVGERVIHVVDPDVFAFELDETVLPYGKSMNINFACTYGVDNWLVCVDGAYTLALSNSSAATLDGATLIATSDESITGVNITATYIPDTSVTDILKVTYGKGSEIIYDFEDGDRAGFVGFDEAKEWCIENGVNNTIVGSDPLAGQFNEQIVSDTVISSRVDGEPVKNGNYALAWVLDNTDATFANWSYNVLFNIGETIVLRDVANGKNATTLGMWLYIPEGATGLAFQSQLYIKQADGSLTHWQSHFTFKTASGTVKNLNSCTEADIPESRWVYASISLTGYDYVCTPVASLEGNNRTPSFIRTYVKPTAPAIHTFYIDDITLDYSEAVDDREAPVISNATYATADTAVTLDNGVTINSNKLVFSANVADDTTKSNYTGLDISSGKIYVDGVAIAGASVSGNVLNSGEVTLTNGTHTVTFEIADKLGNVSSKNYTVIIGSGSVVSIGGHNDLNNLPEYDSVYYIDITAADIAAVNKIVTTLKLQNANTWELDNMIAAEGFEASYVYNDLTGLATITVEKTGAVELTGTQVIVSLPVRVWSWDGYNHVTGAVITPEAQFDTGYCPIVTIDCEVLYGEVEFAAGTNDGYFGSFGGSISVTTNLNDNVNPWHYHTETALDDCAATCTKNGYTGRTYCEVCGSVVDWGTTIPALGHSYEIVDGVLGCVNDGCDKLYNGTFEGKLYVDGVIASGWNGDSYYVDGVALTGIQKIDGVYYNLGDDGISKGKYTGLFVENGKTYYAIAGNLVKGWQLIGDSWYHFNVSSYSAYNGTYSQAYFGISDELTYTFENGKLVSGVWSSTSGRYYYGPSYYKRTWATIDGADYYFDVNGYCLKGYNIITPNPNANPVVYELYKFDSTGKLEFQVTAEGLYDADGDLYYIVDGKCNYAQLIKVGDDYYYIASDFKAVKDTTRYISESGTNGLVTAGNYTFDADGKMVIELNKNGIMEDANGVLRYYVNGQIQYGKGLIEIDGYYYYVNNSGVVATGEYYLSSSWTGNKLPSATYNFGTDGKLDARFGTIEVDGVTKYYAFVADDSGLHYYINAKKQYGLGLINIAGDYYYVNNSGVVATGEYYLSSGWTKNVLPSATYDFGTDGKLNARFGSFEVDGVTKYWAFVADDSGLHYFINARKQYGLGLINVEGDYYYVNNQGIVATGEYYLNSGWTGNKLPSATYNFGTDGKLQGNIGTIEVDGVTKYYAFVADDSGLHYYINAKKQYGLGLITVNGDMYYVNSKGVVATGEYYLDASWTNYQLKSGTYNFGEDGKLILE